MLNAQLQQRADADAYGANKIWVAGCEVPIRCFVGARLIGSTNTAKIISGAFLVVTEMLGHHLQLAAHARLRWALTLRSVLERSL